MVSRGVLGKALTAGYKRYPVNPSEAAPGSLCPVLGSTVQERKETNRKKYYKDDEQTRSPLMRKVLETGLVYSGEKILEKSRNILRVGVKRAVPASFQMPSVMHNDGIKDNRHTLKHRVLFT